MITKFYNATVITLDRNQTIYNGSLTIEDSKIVAVNREYSKPCDINIDCHGDIIMPALVNTHTHLAMTILRGVGEGLELNSWLNQAIFPLESKFDSQLAYWSTMCGIAECVRNGVIGVVDMYMYPHQTVEALTKAGMYGSVAWGGNDLNGDTDNILANMDSDISQINSNNRFVKMRAGVHAEYTCSEDLLIGTADLAQKYNVPTVIHACETLNETGECALRHDDLSPIEYLNQLGYFDYGGVVAHCTHCSRQDFAILKDKNIAVSLNIGSNLKLGSGIPNVFMANKQGVNLTLGTDSTASNNKLDILRECYLLSVVPKGVMNDSTLVKPIEALKACTINAYPQINCNNTNGIIEGASADIIRVDNNSINMFPNNNVVSNLVYSCSSENIKMTMCRGKILYEQGQYYIGESIEDIKQNVQIARQKTGVI